MEIHTWRHCPTSSWLLWVHRFEFCWVFSFTNLNWRQHLDCEDPAPEQARVVCLLHPTPDGSTLLRQCHHCDHLHCLFTSEHNTGDQIFIREAKHQVLISVNKMFSRSPRTCSRLSCLWPRCPWPAPSSWRCLCPWRGSSWSPTTSTRWGATSGSSE